MPAEASRSMQSMHWNSVRMTCPSLITNPNSMKIMISERDYANQMTVKLRNQTEKRLANEKLELHKRIQLKKAIIA